MGREKWVLGNWKMNIGLAASQQFSKKIRAFSDEQPELFESIHVGLCVPFPYLTVVTELLEGSPVKISAQDVSANHSGAFTGEVSAAMLAESGANLTLIGHSERRQYHAENNDLIVNKAMKAFENDLRPIVCIGETLKQREAGLTEKIVGDQLQALFQLSDDCLDQLILAYEPIWAIGTGLSATAQQAQVVHKMLRQQLKTHRTSLAAMPIVYGGSVNDLNASQLFAQEDIDGGLVGAASLDFDKFSKICCAAKH